MVICFKYSLSYFTHSLSSPEEMIVAPLVNAFDEGSSRWKNCLIGQFVGNCPNFSLIQLVANIFWGEKGFVHVTLVERNLYLFHFHDPNTRDWILESGPWHIKNNTLILRKWESGLSCQSYQIINSLLRFIFMVSLWNCSLP